MTNSKRSKVGLIVSIVAVVLAAVTCVGVIFGITHQKADTVEVTNSMYEIGTISETGKILESGKSVYLEDMVTVDGMAIELDEETATITYKVVFYDADNKFLSMTDDLDADYDNANVPENAEYFRVVITPFEVDGESVDVNIFNMSKYTKQLEVSYFNN